MLKCATAARSSSASARGRRTRGTALDKLAAAVSLIGKLKGEVLGGITGF